MSDADKGSGCTMPIALFVISMVAAAILSYAAGYFHGSMAKAEPLVRSLTRKR